jgi:hypothetical protein
MRRNLAIALLTLLLTPAAAQTPPAAAPAPLVFPEDLPEWAFNIPDAVQPPTPPIAGIVRVPGSAREYDATAIAGNNNPPDWFPEDGCNAIDEPCQFWPIMNVGCIKFSGISGCC